MIPRILTHLAHGTEAVSHVVHPLFETPATTQPSI